MNHIDTEEKKRILTEWYQQHYKIMRKKAYDITGDFHIANDMVNEAFIKIMNNFDRIYGLSCSQRLYYFVNTVGSVCIDYMRKKKIESEHINPYKNETADALESEIDTKPTPLQAYESKEFLERLGKYMEKLSPRDADLIVYRCLWEMSYREISRRTGIKESAVSSYVRRAKNRLVKIMNGEGRK